MVAKRLESFVSKRDASETAQVTDLMGSILDLDHEEKLQVLSTVDIPQRLELLVEVLQTHLKKLQSKSRLPSRPQAFGKTNVVDLERFRQLSSLGPPNGDEANDVEQLKKNSTKQNLPPKPAK